MPTSTKSTRSARKLDSVGKKIIFIGHRNHPEFLGTSGQLDNDMILVETTQDAQNINLPPNTPLAYITQATLSIDDTSKISDIIKQRFPWITGQYQDSICYAAQNRQNAIKDMMESIELLLVLGSKNSSNSNSLRDLGAMRNIPSYLIDGYDSIKDSWLKDIHTLGISASASAPESLVQEVVSYLRQKFDTEGIAEDVVFHVPKIDNK